MIISVLLMCVSVYACVSARAKCASVCVDWRRATAGSNYKDMKQIVGDCCFYATLRKNMCVNVHGGMIDRVVFRRISIRPR